MRRRGDVDKKRGETEKVNQDKMLNQAKRLVYSTNAPNEVKDDWGDGGEEKAHCSKKPAVEVVGECKQHYDEKIQIKGKGALLFIYSVQCKYWWVSGWV